MTRYKGKPTAWWKDGTPVDIAFFCNCPKCGASNQGTIGGFPTRSEAIAAWNTRKASRAPAPETAGLVEPSLGWLFITDDGLEWSNSHPVESGEDQYAEEIRPATLTALKNSMIYAWKDLMDKDDALTAMQSRLDDVTAERDAARDSSDIWMRQANALQEQLAQAREAGFKEGRDAALVEASKGVGFISRIRALTPSPTRSTEDGA